MAMNYRELDSAQQAQMLKDRIAAFERDHYGHQLNLDGLAAQPNSEDKTKAVEYAQEAQAAIEAAHDVAVAELDKITESE